MDHDIAHAETRGPCIGWNHELISQLRTLVRLEVDALWSDRGVEMVATQVARKRQDRTFLEYTTTVREFVTKGVERATGTVAPLEGYICAPSLLSAISRIWPGKSQARITCVFPNRLDKEIPEEFATEAAAALDECTASPIHILCSVQASDRPLWYRFDKPLIYDNELSNALRANLKDLRNAASNLDVKHSDTYEHYLKELLSKIRPSNAGPVEQALAAVARHLDSDPIYKLAQMRGHHALIDALVACLIAPGAYLWMFGFDPETPPSPYRVVAVPTDDDNAEVNSGLRRWLNIYAGILGEVASVERSLAIFIRSMQSRAQIIKCDPARSSRLENTQRAYWDVQRWCAAESDPLAKSRLSGVLALLPPARTIIAQRHSLMTMPSYRAPSLRDILLRHPVSLLPGESVQIVRGVFKRMFDTFYAMDRSLSCRSFGIPEDKLDDWGRTYVEERYFGRLRERWDQTRRLVHHLEHASDHDRRHRGHSNKDDVALLLYMSGLLSQTGLTLTYRVGDAHRRFSVTKDGVPTTLIWNPGIIRSSIKEIVAELERQWRNRELECLLPPRPWLIHGDLHFDNILIDISDHDDPLFKLIDYSGHRGGGDIAYDFGKMLHSCNGLYDFLHEDLFSIARAELEEGFDLCVGNGVISEMKGGGGSGAEVVEYVQVDTQIHFYREIANEMFSTIRELARKAAPPNGTWKDVLGEDWEKRSLFAEAFHFLTMAPFHMEESMPRALAILHTGIMLLVEWCLRYDIIPDLEVDCPMIDSSSS